MDVYLIGVDIPVKEYTGRIIGIVHREDDSEDKLVRRLKIRIFLKMKSLKKSIFRNAIIIHI